jgi:DNA-binding transcriptional regulator YhcF (GntR family)
MYLSTDNDNAGRESSLARAWMSGRPFAVPYDAAVTPVDFDDEELPRYQDARRVLAKEDAPFLEVASGGPASRRRHIFAYTPDETQRAGIQGELEDLLGKKAVRAGSLMRPPGSPHHSGRVRSMLMDRGQLDAMISMVVPDPESVWNTLQPSTRDLITAGPGRSNRSDWDHIVTWRLILGGLSDTQILVLALWDQTPFSMKMREQQARGPGQGLAYLLGGIAKIRAKATIPHHLIHSRQDADQYLNRIRAAAETIPSADLGGILRRRVFLAVIDMCAGQHTTTGTISIRSLGAAAGVHRNTASAALRDFVKAGWLKFGSAASGARAAEYSLDTPRFVTYLKARGGVPSRYVTRTGETNHVVFWHGHLNESGRLVYGAIPNGPAVTRSHVIQVTGLAPSTVDRAFKKLVSWGLLERPERGLYVRVDVDLDVLAETYELDLREKKREQGTERERIQYGRYRLARIAESSRDVDVRLWLPVDSYSVANRLTSQVVAIDDLPAWRPTGPGETFD